MLNCSAYSIFPMVHRRCAIDPAVVDERKLAFDAVKLTAESHDLEGEEQGCVGRGDGCIDRDGVP